KEIIADERRTVISGLTADEIKEQEKRAKLAQKESAKNSPCWITRFTNGTLMKTSEPFEYNDSVKTYKYSPVIEQIESMTHDDIVVVTSDGNGHKIPLSYLIESLPAGPQELGVTIPEDVSIVGISKVQKKLKKHDGLLMMTN